MLGLVLFCVAGICIITFRAALWDAACHYYHFFSDRDQIRPFVASFGPAGPAIFIIIQILQVLLAPIPGEATGFIGGYLFGTGMGFFYSSIGLTAGSWLNFSVGRLFGKRFVRRLIPEEQFDKFNRILKRQGVIVIFILFVFPGFPKDFLCLFLGLSTLPLKLFMVLSAVGRMPGTFMLSMQGASLYRQSYGMFAALVALCLVFALIGYRYRESFYQWAARFNNR